MKLRPPAIPLVTNDPYFSIWSQTDVLTDSPTVHWTGKPIELCGIAEIDGKAYRFIGNRQTVPAMKQLSFDLDAFSSKYVFAAAGVELTVCFTSPVKPDDLYLVSRPVSYLSVSKTDTDGKAHTVSVRISASEQVCLDSAGQYAVKIKQQKFGSLDNICMGSVDQPVLEKDGDDLRIDWGYFYLTAEDAETGEEKYDEMTWIYAKKAVADSVLFTLAYDDIKSIEYFGEHLEAYWRKSESIRAAIGRAHRDYEKTAKKCRLFSEKLVREATAAGGEKYAELLLLSLRQSVAAHKLVVTNDGELLFVSKECFSNGCASTVDVSYPSIPLFLLYNPQLVQAMVRPVYRYAQSDAWQFDFAPHDAGRYPKLNGQKYHGTDIAYQMPLEECGNMLLIEATTAIALGNTDFAVSHMALLEQWGKYLIDNGTDPENQLCTDDFAGHLAHNCNLTLKAIMGIVGLSIIKHMTGDGKAAAEYEKTAREMAASWKIRAANGDGSYRLGFDWQNSFSMKYNMVWDKLFGTEIFDADIMKTEFASYKKHMNRYGLPLDNRADYTKSDWYIWCGVMAHNRTAFEAFITPLWNAYNETESRVPMTDWYFTTTAKHRSYGKTREISFRNRTVVGGHFMKLLEYKKTLKVK